MRPMQPVYLRIGHTLLRLVNALQAGLASLQAHALDCLGGLISVLVVDTEVHTHCLAGLARVLGILEMEVCRKGQ